MTNHRQHSPHATRQHATHAFITQHTHTHAGRDARHHSREFAEIAAKVFLSRGVPVKLFSTITPTPFVAFGTAYLGAAAGACCQLRVCVWGGGGFSSTVQLFFDAHAHVYAHTELAIAAFKNLSLPTQVSWSRPPTTPRSTTATKCTGATAARWGSEHMATALAALQRPCDCLLILPRPGSTSVHGIN